jgi:hypothetical protein
MYKYSRVKKRPPAMPVVETVEKMEIPDGGKKNHQSFLE